MENNDKDNQSISRIIRPELNIEQWSIWQPTNGQSSNGRAPKAKEMGGSVVCENGIVKTAKVIVGTTNLGALTTEDEKTYYALQLLWEKAGKPIDTPVKFSMRGIVEVLRKGWGKISREGVVKSLQRLRANPIFFELAFYDAVKKRRIVKLPNPMTILIDLIILKKEDLEEIQSGVQERNQFQFHPMILGNMQAGYTKPVLLDVILGFKSEIAQLTYPLIDRNLSNKEIYKTTSLNLFTTLGLTNPTYKHLSARTRTLNRAIADLNGKPLSSGGVIEARLEPTKDKKDVNAVFRKTKPALKGQAEENYKHKKIGNDLFYEFDHAERSRKRWERYEKALEMYHSMSESEKAKVKKQAEDSWQKEVEAQKDPLLKEGYQSFIGSQLENVIEQEIVGIIVRKYKL